MTKETRLEIVRLVENRAIAGTYALVLQETGGNRRFSVIIGEAEAQSIALRVKRKTLPRPLTHDLTCNIMYSLQAELKKVSIYALIDDMFYANLYIEDRDGVHHTVDARTSDAVALALWADCPIYIKGEVLAVVGTPADDGEEQTTTVRSLDDVEEAADEELRLLSADELDDLLAQAVDEERYELAARLKQVSDMKNK